MKSNLLESLNINQQQALQETSGPLLILAGAGSGKTRVLTYKTTYLIQEKQIDPSHILLVTFTNKAANEIRERISKLLDDNRNLPLTTTFHSLCAKILRRDGKASGIPSTFLIYDEEDSKEAIKETYLNLNISDTKLNPAAVLNTISEAKNELIGPLEYPQYARGYFQTSVAKIYLEYQNILIRNKALDFDDLIFETVKLFQKNDGIADYYQNKFHYILIDEYQDTNHAQYVLSKLLAKRWRNICVVGDASQSIYGWRGADFRNILNFKEDYKDVKTFNLERNYRSHQKILDASFSIIAKNKSHPILKLWTKEKEGDAIGIFQATNEQEEASFVTNKISGFVTTDKNTSYADMAVLYRTNAQSRVIEEAFLHEGIPYCLVGGVRFYERKEVKDALAHLRLLVNPKDTVSRKRISKLGKKRFDKFLIFLDSYKTIQNNKTQSTLEILDNVLTATDYLSLYKNSSEEDLSRLENLKELRSVAAQFPDPLQFLENVSLVEQEYYPDHPLDSEKKNAVLLMTLHAAKGLEFDSVFMIGMEEGLFPHSRSLLDTSELEEERRLCYVGMTRAKKRLFLSYANRRLYFGQRSANQVSRFVTELPEHLTVLAEHHFI
jgi:DNA helicase-2/ATP-dependent DNA helicase PcrA